MQGEIIGEFTTIHEDREKRVKMGFSPTSEMSVDMRRHNLDVLRSQHRAKSEQITRIQKELLSIADEINRAKHELGVDNNAD
ncbi:hypothetical protein LCGC14_1025080 [marine sediment metagenome]|uniref:Uncharacterized protein n=1 Tax=marine sediment metagenome TaxID=412755 RepID=A0A0F9R257_9ZZZZ